MWKNKGIHIVFLLFLTLFVWSIPTHAQVEDIGDIYDIAISPVPCNRQQPDFSCPTELATQYQDQGEACATSFEDFAENPTSSHYWIEDPEITALGKSDERARQFLYWVINTSAIDSAPVLGEVWTISSIIAIVGIVLVGVIFGIGFIVSQKTRFGFNIKIQVMPTILKIGVMLLYVAVSAGLIFILVSISEVLMKFFIENLGGRDLFNIYFANTGVTPDILGQTEENYKAFVGCRDLNIRVQEGIQAEVFLLKLTNITYYVMGVMLLLRKILLWFLLFVAPFLALLMPFVFIRNTGWIWMGVFFQWLFYGPLLALFLGATSTIWKNGIPFNFDFSRASISEGYVYPTGINIVYGGPAQRIQGAISRPIGALNNGSYIDTFAEYVITLIMLWAVTFFPWWLLRIFRDYCCDGIYASRNILLAMYDQMRGGPVTGPSPGPVPTMPALKLDVDTKTPTSQNVNVSIGNLDQIRKTITTDITKNLNLQARNLTEIAQLETNKTTNKALQQNIAYLANPVQASIPAQRQQFMQLRSELFNRSIKNDTVAQKILASTSMSQSEKIRVRNEIVRAIPVLQSVSQATQNITNVSESTSTNIAQSYTTAITKNETAIKEIAKKSNMPEPIVLQVIQNYAHHLKQPVNVVVDAIANEVQISKENVQSIFSFLKSYGHQFYALQKAKNTYQLSQDQITNIVSSVKKNTQVTRSPVESLSQTLQIPVEKTAGVVKELVTKVVQTPSLIGQIANQTMVSPTNVSAILKIFQEQSQSTVEKIQETIARSISISEETIRSVVTQLPKLFVQQSAESATQTPYSILTQSVQHSSEINQQNISTFLKNIQASNALVSYVTTQTQVPQATVRTLLTVLSRNISQPLQNTLNEIKSSNITTNQANSVLSTVSNYVTNHSESIQQLRNNTSLPTQTVSNVISQISQIVKQNEIVKSIAKDTKTTTQTVESIIRSIPEILSQTIQKQSIVSSIRTTLVPSISQTLPEIRAIFQGVLTSPQLLAQLATEIQIPAPSLQSVVTVLSNVNQSDIGKILQRITTTSHVSYDQITSLLEKIQSVFEKDGVTTHTIETATQVSETGVQRVISSLASVESSQNESVFSLVQKQESSVSSEQFSSMMTALSKNTENLQYVSSITNASQKTVSSVLSEVGQKSMQPTRIVLRAVSEKEHITTEQAQEILTQTSMFVKEHPEIIPVIQQSTRVSANTIATTIQQLFSSVSQYQTSQPVTQNSIQTVLTSLANNTDLVTNVSQTTQQSADRIKNVLNEIANTISSTPKTMIETIGKNLSLSFSELTSVLQTSANYISNNPTSLQSISQTTSLPTQQVSTIAQGVAAVIQTPASFESETQTITEHVQTFAQTRAEHKTQVEAITLLNTLKDTSEVVQAVSQHTSSTPQQVALVYDLFAKEIEQNTYSPLETITKQTSLSTQDVTSILQQTYAEISNNRSIENRVSETSQLPIPVIQNLLYALPHAIEQSGDSIVNQVAQTSRISEEQATMIIQSVFSSASEDDTTVETIASTTNLNPQQVKNVLTSYVQNIHTPREELLQQIYESSGVAKEHIQSVLSSSAEFLATSHALIDPIAEEQEVSEEDVANVINSQMELALEPEKHIENTIEIPQSVSLEDYEEVKAMWIRHYEKGEVPISETITSRIDWIEQEIVFITNTLNKILSSDEGVRQQGLDELGYLLPIFLINNFKGEELVVYLKAKLEAAKTVLTLLRQAEAIREEYEQKDNEEFVDVRRTEEEEHSKHLSADLDGNTPKPMSIEDRQKAVQEKLSSVQDNQNRSHDQKLQEVAEKLKEEAEN